MISLLFVLPDGRSAPVPIPSARLICERLWALGITPGAATAAVRISEALSTQSWRGHGNDVAFDEREVSPLIEAAQVAPPTWSHACHDAAPAIPAHERAHIRAKCDELIKTLDGLHDHYKVHALVAELERLRDSM